MWFKDLEWWEEAQESWEKGRDLETVLEEEGREADGKRLSKLLNRLFEAKADEETGKPYTDEKVAWQSGGVLTEEDVKAMREGRLADPTWAQILALCDIFEVEPSYWSGRDAPSWQPSPAILEAAEGMDSYIIFQNSLKLSGRDRSMLKILSTHLKREPEETTDHP